MISSLMATPFLFAADVIPEPVLGGAVRGLVEMSCPPEFVERQRPVEPAVLVEGLVQTAVGEYAPVPAEPAAGQAVKRRGAVRAHAVVPAGRATQAVDGVGVIEEGSP